MDLPLNNGPKLSLSSISNSGACLMLLFIIESYSFILYMMLSINNICFFNGDAETKRADLSDEYRNKHNYTLLSVPQHLAVHLIQGHVQEFILIFFFKKKSIHLLKNKITCFDDYILSHYSRLYLIHHLISKNSTVSAI
ncbi:hypothetical protein ACJX0J_039325, partial [Zea mays]